MNERDESRVVMTEDPQEQLDADFPALASRVDAMTGRGVSLEAAYLVAALLEVSDALTLADGEDAELAAAREALLERADRLREEGATAQAEALERQADGAT